MKTIFRQCMLTLTFLTLCIDWSIAQTQSSSSSSKSQTAEKRDRKAEKHESKTDAINSGRFELSQDGGEYKLEHDIQLSPASSEKPKLKVEYQIGTIDEKPVNIGLVVDRDKVPRADKSKKANEMFDVKTDKPVRISGPEQESLIQRCKDGKTCVRTDQEGRCIKWVCS